MNDTTTIAANIAAAEQDLALWRRLRSQIPTDLGCVAIMPMQQMGEMAQLDLRRVEAI